MFLLFHFLPKCFVLFVRELMGSTYTLNTPKICHIRLKVYSPLIHRILPKYVTSGLKYRVDLHTKKYGIYEYTRISDASNERIVQKVGQKCIKKQQPKKNIQDRFFFSRNHSRDMVIFKK